MKRKLTSLGALFALASAPAFGDAITPPDPGPSYTPESRPSTAMRNARKVWSVGGGAGFVAQSSRAMIVGSLERSLGSGFRLGLYGGTITPKDPLDLTLTGGIEAKYFMLKNFFAGPLAGLELNRVKGANGNTSNDWYADLGAQLGARFFFGGSYAIGPIYQFIYTVDFKSGFEKDRSFVSNYYGALFHYYF